MSLPLVTIGLTTYNAAETLERAMASAFAQSWRPIEIVVVDDCSSDSTQEILRRVAGCHSEVRLFTNAINSGVAVSRNRIIDEAKGEFLAFFDDDDESLPERIAAQIRRILDYEDEFANGAPVVCHTARNRIYVKGFERIEGTMGQALGRRAPHGIAVAERILLGSPLADGYGACPTCSQMARLSTYRMVGGFDPLLRRGEDTDFTIRVAQAGGHFVGIGEPLVTQWMTKTPEKSLVDEFNNLMLMMEKHRFLMEKVGQYDFCLQWVRLKRTWLERRYWRFSGALLLLALRHPVLTFRRLSMAIPNTGLNLAFSFFHH